MPFVKDPFGSQRPQGSLDLYLQTDFTLVFEHSVYEILIFLLDTPSSLEMWTNVFKCHICVLLFLALVSFNITL